MKKSQIQNIVLIELFNFISHYYDIKISEYIMEVFSLEAETMQSTNVQCLMFFKILQYLQKMAADKAICFKAGQYFSKNRLLRAVSIPMVRLFMVKAFKVLDKILKE